MTIDHLLRIAQYLQTEFVKNFKNFFSQDEIQTRIFNIDEEQLCYGRPNVIFPKKAKNLNDEWVWVVNIDNYTQSVEVIDDLKNQKIFSRSGGGV